MSRSKLNRLLVLGLVIAGCAQVQANVGDSAIERQAFEEARDSWLAFISTGREGNIEAVWSRALRVLAMSKQPIADQYLANLSQFRLDGAIGSEFSCAASKRGAHLSVLLKRAQARFSTANYCYDFAAAKRVDVNQLCASETEFKRVVRTLRKLPLKDASGACSY